MATASRRKTDNASPDSKLALRRYFLEKYHRDVPPRVLDCCQGGGLLWTALRKDFHVGRYWGVDTKPKKGRMKLESERILEQFGWQEDVIDVDTYGSPWSHWYAILKTMPMHPITVFLTAGHITIQGGVTDNALKRALGINFAHLDVPRAIYARLQPLAVLIALSDSEKWGIHVVEAMEAPPGPNVRYIGVRLERKPAATNSAMIQIASSHTEPAATNEGENQ